MSKLSVLAASLVAVSTLAFAAPALATSAGQLAGGPDIYQVRNVTKNTSYSSAASATCNEVVKYSVKLSNTEYGLLSDVTVKASLSGGTMTASAKNSANETVNTSGKVNVTVDKGTLNYVAGSTQLFTVDGKLIKNLSDGVTAGGVNAGTLNGSTREFLQFQAKVTCDTPQAPTYTCDLLNIKAEEGRNVTVTEFKTSSANGAVFKHAVLNWGDNSAAVTTANAVGQKHQYAADGTYTVKATAVFTVDGKEVSNTNANCSKVVTFVAEKPPVVTPPETPEVLVNTGAGSILGLFAAITVAGALAHRLVWTRIRG